MTDIQAEPTTAADRVDVLGIHVSVTNLDHTVGAFADWIEQGDRQLVCVTDMNALLHARADERLTAVYNTSGLTVPDGMPLVWALRMLGHPIESRVYGPDLMDIACARAARTGQRCYLYGGRNHGALAQLARELRLRHPGLQIVGGYAPPFRPLTADEEAAVAAEINASRADVVWVGIGVPKQEKWMAQMRDRLDAPVLIGVGAAFDFHAGIIPQAPPMMQRCGLEWLYRLRQEPRRLWKRYLTYNPRFVLGFARQLVRGRVRS